MNAEILHNGFSATGQTTYRNHMNYSSLSGAIIFVSAKSTISIDPKANLKIDRTFHRQFSIRINGTFRQFCRHVSAAKTR